jgi:hypothetical protein
MSGGVSDERTDLYAFATVAYEVLTGRPVISSAMVPDLLRGKGKQSLKPASTLVNFLPTEVDGLLLHALAQRPEDRPQNLVAWAEEVADWLDQVPALGGWPEEIPFTAESINTPPQAPTQDSGTRPHGEAPEGKRTWAP